MPRALWRQPIGPPNLSHFSAESIMTQYLGGLTDLGTLTTELTRRDLLDVGAAQTWQDIATQANELAQQHGQRIIKEDPQAIHRWPLNLPTARIDVNRE